MMAALGILLIPADLEAATHSLGREAVLLKSRS